MSDQDHIGYFEADACDLNEFKTIIDRTQSEADVPNAAKIEKDVPIYDMAKLRPALEQKESRREILIEWGRVFMSGSGVLVLKGAYADTGVIDEATKVYDSIIEAEKLGSGGGSDHFAAKGANDRVWNSLQKLCEHDPALYLRYFANTSIAAACEAWLGPNFQMTAQVNLVHPGGEAQQAHRDYHLGFQTPDVCGQYPAHVHDLSPTLTLQGAIAHVDMPVESGPTKLLPFSQTYRAGYAAWRRDDFRDLFEERCIQLPLAKGDALFFNPALFHAAGANTSNNIHRMANLMQISSAFGRALESINRKEMCKATYPHALQAQKSGLLNPSELRAAIACTAEGYPFSTNLDTDPPVGGLAPESQQAYFMRAMVEKPSSKEFNEHL
ncbi:MAG: phytanoyl-CoA dioxygenase family protein, partial [Pseudomonadota bacterium]